MRPSDLARHVMELAVCFAAWRAAAAEARAYWRRRRDAAARRLGRRGAQALWALCSALRRYVAVEMGAAGRPLKGARVRSKRTLREGQFFSMSEKVCKVLLDGDQEVCFVEAKEFLELRALPHPFLAQLAFVAWTLCHAEEEDLKIEGLRTALMFNQVMGRSSGKLTMMAVMQEETQKGLKFCFAAWKKAMKSKSLKKFQVKRLKEAFKAWLEVLLMEHHDRALGMLESTQVQLKRAERNLEQKGLQRQKMKAKLDRMHFLRLVDLFR